MESCVAAEPVEAAEPLEEAAWRVIDKHVEDATALVKHQIDSFEHFVSTGIEQVVAAQNPIEVCAGPYSAEGAAAIRYSVRMSEVSLGRCVTHDRFGQPTVILPNDARLRNLTYAAQIHVDVDITATRRGEDGVVSVAHKRIGRVHVGSVPIMVGSRYCTLHDRQFRGMECPFDPAGPAAPATSS
jgi:DNA-directed RNA polymerase II subunit RPB2